MKKILLVASIFILITLSGCDIINTLIDSDVYHYLDRIEYPNLSSYDLSSVTNVYQASLWVRNRVTYRKDVVDYWQTPQETLDRGYGDCEDITLLVIAVIKEALGLEFELVMLKMDSLYLSRTIEAGGIPDHVIMRYQGVLYSAQWGNQFGVGTVMYSYTFAEIYY